MSLHSTSKAMEAISRRVFVVGVGMTKVSIHNSETMPYIDKYSIIITNIPIFNIYFTKFVIENSTSEW